MTLLLAALFGLLFGSFLNVCIYRLPRDIGVVVPRSFCPECGAPIAALDNIPLVSYFLLLRGKCRRCRVAISWRYPAVEAMTALAFALVVWRYGITWAGMKWLVFEALMMVLFWTDLEERILPDEFTLGGLVLGVGAVFVVDLPGTLLPLLLAGVPLRWRPLVELAVSAAVLSLPIWLVGALYAKLRGREGLGLGDVKLLALMGAFLGLENGLLGMLVASLAGSAAGVFLLFRHRREALHFELPFGSFLCAGAALLPLVKRLS